MRKDEYISLRTLAATLPVIFNHSQEKRIVSGAELIEDYVEGADDVDADKKYIENMPVMIAINHYRKMKRLYQKDGFPRVLAYMKAVRKYDQLSKQ
jgi:hypothetical protein